MSVPEALPPSTTSGVAPSHSQILSIPLTTTTPTESPASNCDSVTKSQHKKVGFLASTRTHNGVTPTSETSVKSLPPSRECQVNTKSILKNSSQIQGPPEGMAGQQSMKPSLDVAMESIVQQLARDDTPINIDAYTTLLGVLRAYDDIPEAAMSKDRILTVLRFIRRDLSRKEKSYATPGDTTIMTQALKVLTTVVWNPGLSPYLTDDYKGFILDNSINVLAEHSAPKSVIAHYLHLLSVQKFRHGLLAANTRSTRLIDALNELRHHVRGGSITSERLTVFLHLLDQARTAMHSKSVDWLEDMLHTMTSSIKDLRSKAILLGTKACSVYASSSSIASIVDDVLESQTENGTKFGALMCRRLEKMVKESEEGLDVPPIWAIVILLVSGRQGGIGKWASLEEWLKVIQRCFNSGESSIRLRTYYAWNRFVYAIKPHEASDKLVSILVKPIIAQLDKASTDKQSRSSRPAVLSSYCNLLYYAFRPAATHKQYTRVWNSYIVQIMTNAFFDRNSANADFACRIVISLLWNNSGQTKIWKENRAHENTAIDPEELPVVDCKWVRSQCRGILLMFKLLFARSHWGPEGTPDQAFIATSWRNFAKSLGEASRKEVKPSTETKHAIASLVDFSGELWAAGPQCLNVEGEPRDKGFQQRLRFICRAMVLEIGTVPFIDALETRHAMSNHVLLSGLISSVTSSHLQSRSKVHVLPNPRGGSGVNAPLLWRLMKLLDRELCKAYGRTGRNDDDLKPAVQSAIECLQSPDEKVSFTCLTGLASSACLWLQDQKHYLAYAASDLEGDLAHANGLRSAFIAALGMVEAESIAAVDDIFAAAFGSENKNVVTGMIKIWNSSQGQMDNLSYPPRLTTILRRLQPYVDLSLPGFGDSTDDGETYDPPAFLFETEHQAVSPRPEQEVMNMTNENRIKVKPFVENRLEAPQVQALASAQVQTRSIVTPPVSNKRKHDDSQIHFVALESSPPAHALPDPQFLTERQKEIRDRQKAEPVVFFSDLRSSPRPDRTSSRLHSRGSTHAEIEDIPSTPVLPPQTARDEEDLAALSPTPQRKQHVLHLDDIDVPSSPPSRLEIVDDILVEHNLHNVELLEPGLTGLDQNEAESDLRNATAQETSSNPSNIGRSVFISGSEHQQPHASPKTMQNPLLEIPVATKVDSIRKPAIGQDQTDPQRIIDQEEHQPGVDEFQSPANSSEIDELSASQLSQDLNWHVNIGSSTTAPVAHPERLEVGYPGKRKQPSQHSTVQRSTKRRRSTYSLSPEPEPEPTDAVIHEKETEDCIVVDMTPKQISTTEKRSHSSRTSSRRAESVLSHSSQTSTSTAGRGRTRGRGRPRLRKPTSSPIPALEQPSSLNPTDHDDPQPSHLQREPKQQKTEDIISSLQIILNQLKTIADGSEINLRRVDDLCFEIRTEAQNAVLRRIG